MSDLLRHETLKIADKVTVTAEALPEGKIRLTSSGLDREVAIMADQTLELRWSKQVMQVLRKRRLPCSSDPPVPKPFDYEDDEL